MPSLISKTSFLKPKVKQVWSRKDIFQLFGSMSEYDSSYLSYITQMSKNLVNRDDSKNLCAKS